MKKPIIVSVIMALIILLAGSFFAPGHAQDPGKEEKPTFYRLIPGVYVNGYPRFTIHYPKDWVERTPFPQETFRASAPGPVPYPALVVAPFAALPSFPFSLEVFADSLAKALRATATDLTVLSDKPSRFRDGTPAREVELQGIRNDKPYNVMGLVAKKGGFWVNMAVESQNGKIGEDLKAILYSVECEPGKDEPVKLPPDVQEFFDNVNHDIVSHDVAKVMSHYSDRFLNSGNRKGEVERFWRQFIGFWTSHRPVVTDFIPADDRAYVGGFVTGWLGGAPMFESIIKENGEWKFYGNQRDVSR
jgi:hypothetical protein